LRGLVDFGRNAQAWPVKDAAWTEPYRQEFRDAIADDLNVPQGLAAVWSLVREGNQRQDRAAWEAILDFDRVLGLGFADLTRVIVAAGGMEMKGRTGPFFVYAAGTPEGVMDLTVRRWDARARKDWGEADRLRHEIAQLGYDVEDTSNGARVKPRP